MKPFTRVTADCETNGLLDTLTVIHSLVLKCIDTGKRMSCHDHGGAPTIEEGLEVLANAELLVFQNGIKFDIPAIQKVYPKWKPRGLVRDTLVLSRMLCPDILEKDWKLVDKGKLPPKLAGRHSLEAWGYRLGVFKGEYTDWCKKNGIDDPWSTWRPEMQEYCDQDVEGTDALWKHFVSRLANGWSEECVELEHAVAWIIARQERYGFSFNVELAAQLYAELAARCAELEQELQSVFPPKKITTVFVPKVNNKKMGYVKGEPFEKVKIVPFKASSRAQVAERLMELGWKPNAYGKDGVPTIDDEILNSLDYPQAKALSEYFMLQKRVGMLSTGKGAWLKLEKDGVMYGGVNPCGTPTARMTHQGPNMAQVPAARSPYGKECRGLFGARKGKKLLGCDADALELRDLAGYMAKFDGGEYIRVVLEGKKEDGTDMHSVNARALGLDPKKEYMLDGKMQPGREIAKRWFYAFIYGAGDVKLGTLLIGLIIDKLPTDPEERERMFKRTGGRSKKNFLTSLPAFANLVSRVKALAKKRGFLKGLDGRKLRVRSEHSALNTLLQSAGAIQMKRALVILDNTLQEQGLVPGVDYEFVANVHDEWQIEVKPKLTDKIGEIAADSIRLAGEYYKFRCPLKGNYSVGETWADTH